MVQTATRGRRDLQGQKVYVVPRETLENGGVKVIKENPEKQDQKEAKDYRDQKGQKVK